MRRCPTIIFFSQAATRAAVPTLLGSPAMTRLLQTTIAGSLPKPVLARRARRALGPLEPRRRGARRGKTRTRSASSSPDQDRGRARDRDRRRADAPPLRDDLYRDSKASTSSTSRPSGSGTATMRTCPRVVGPVARPGAGLRRRREVPARGDRPQGEVHAARPDDYGRHPLRRVLREPREARLGVRRDPERGSTGDRGAGRGCDPVRRARVQRLFRRGSRLGRRALERAAQGSPARPRCTSATDTASRRTSSGRRRSARMAAIRADVSAAREVAIDQVSLECANSHVPIELIGLLEGKDVLVGAIDVATDRIETPRTSPRRSVRRSALRARGAPLPLHELRDGPARPGRRPRQARALGAGAALVRAELPKGAAREYETL